MSSYIDAEKLEKDGWSASRTYPQDAHTMVYETKKMTDFPTADVVEVVRCRNCTYREGSACDYSAVYVRPNGYCQWGERREE